MFIGQTEIDDKEYNRIVLSLLTAIYADVNVQREFIMTVSARDLGDVQQIHETYRHRYQKTWDALVQSLYAKFGKLDLDDLFPDQS